MLSDEPVAVRTPSMIGRASLLDAIRAALEHQDSCALFFSGPGGIGKTRLLEEVDTITLGWQGEPLCHSGIIDLYHARHHSPDGLRQAVAAGLDPDGRHFASYREHHAEYERLLTAGVGGERIEELRLKQEEQFRQDYVALAMTHRLILCFDTVELIQYESDLVQELCQVEDDETAVKNWFLREAALLPNTVVLFAGRPHPRIQSELKSRFTAAGCRYAEFTLDTFSEDEVRAYVEAVRDIRPPEQQEALAEVLRSDQVSWLYRQTGGRPIRLMLYLECLAHELAPVLPQGKGGPDAEEEREFEKALVEYLRHVPLAHPGFITDYLFRARKGLDAGLLRHLAGATIPEEALQPTLATLATYAFVKTRREGLGQVRIFLHDELYELYDRYFSNDPLDRIEFGSYAEYYRRRVADAGLGEREELMLAQLYYELQWHPRTGFYERYAPWDDDAIQDRAISFDIRLRDEVLRFTNRYSRPGDFYDPTVAADLSLAEVDRDSAVRWVKRYHARGQYQRALEVGRTLFHSQAPTLCWDKVDDPIYKAGLLVEWAMAAILNGQPEPESLPKLEQALELLPDERTYDPRQAVHRSRIIGRAYTHIGYLHRTRGRYDKALACYLRALPYFGKEALPVERAGTLTNLAYLQALLERVNPARDHINEALEIRRELGRDHPIALSQNTLGIIFTMQDRPDKGVRECRQALEICRRLGEWRGIGLTHIALGYSLRKLADQWKSGECNSTEAAAFLSEGVEHLEEAVRIFSVQTPEPLREWEACNELGSLFCDWGWLVRKGDQRPPAIRQREAFEIYRRSDQWQQRALALARKQNLSFQIADSLDDLAQVHNDLSVLLREMGDEAGSKAARDQGDAELKEIHASIPDEFYLKPGRRASTDPEESRIHWRTLGKLALQRSTRLFEDLQAHVVPDSGREAALREATREMLLAAIYFKYYQHNSYAYDYTPVRLARRLKALGVSFSWADKVLREFEAEYNQLDLVRETLSDYLGI